VTIGVPLTIAPEAGGAAEAGAAAAVVALDRIGKRYGNGAPVLADISLEIEAGGLYCLTGERGAGKTTLLNIVCLAEPASDGKVTLFGADVTASLDRAVRAALRRRIGVVFQDLRLIDRLSAYDNVALPLRIAGAAEAQIRTNVPELLAWVGLDRRNERPVAALSAGERQLVAVARAIVARPALLVADEPAANLDQDAAEELISIFEQISGLGTTVLIATRYEAFADRLAPLSGRRRPWHLDRGRLVTTTEPVSDDDC